MSKNYLNKTTVDYNFPETEVIIEDFSLEFYKCELMQNKTKQKNETEISINNKNIIISVPKQIVGKDKNMIEKNKKISSPKKDVNMASPKAANIKPDAKRNESFIRSPKNDFISSQKNYRKNGEISHTKQPDLLDSVTKENNTKKPSNEVPLKSNQFDKEEKQFLNKYEKFINKEQFKNVIPRSDSKNSNNHYLRLIYLCKFIKANGGFTNEDKFQTFNQPNNYFKTGKEAKTFYHKYLSHFLLHENNRDFELEELATYDEKNINEIPVLHCPKDINEINNVLSTCLKQKIVILRGFYEAFKIDDSLFSVSEIQTEFHSNFSHLNVIDQSSIGFKKKDKNIKEGSKEQKAYSLNHKYLKRINDELNSKLSEKISSLSKEDALQYLKSTIVPGPCTTLTNDESIFGGREQQSRLIYFHLNHGPGENIWYSIDGNEANKMRKLVMNQFNVDIFSEDSDWFVETDFFIKNGINMFYGKQVKGDILVVGHGMYHWHKTVKTNTSSSWNFCAKSTEQFKHSFEKEIINKELNQQSPFSLTKLLFELIDNEIENLDNELIQYAKEWLKPKIMMNLEIMSKIEKHKLFGNAIIHKSERIQSENCTICKGELFILGGYYTDSPVNLICLICLESVFLNDKREVAIFYNYDQTHLKNFISKLNFNPKFLHSSTKLSQSKETNENMKTNFKSKTLNSKQISLCSEFDYDKYTPEIFQLLEMNLDQDLDSPLLIEKDKIELNEFNLNLVKDPRFSPSDPFGYDLLGSMSISNLDKAPFFNDFVKSPKQRYQDDSSYNLNSVKRVKDPFERSESFANSDLSSLIKSKTLLESKYELKKRFCFEGNADDVHYMQSDSRENILNNGINTQDNIQMRSPTNNKNEQQHIKFFIRNEIRTCLKVLDDLKTREAKKIKYYKEDPVKKHQISILKKYMNNPEIAKEYNLEKFVKEVKENMDLIEPYRNIFSSIYEEFLQNGR